MRNTKRHNMLHAGRFFFHGQRWVRQGESGIQHAKADG